MATLFEVDADLWDEIANNQDVQWLESELVHGDPYEPAYAPDPEGERLYWFLKALTHADVIELRAMGEQCSLVDVRDASQPDMLLVRDYAVTDDIREFISDTPWGTWHGGAVAAMLAAIAGAQMVSMGFKLSRRDDDDADDAGESLNPGPDDEPAVPVPVSWTAWVEV